MSPAASSVIALRPSVACTTVMPCISSTSVRTKALRGSSSTMRTLCPRRVPCCSAGGTGLMAVAGAWWAVPCAARQVQPERAAGAELAFHGDLAAELGGDLAADGQAEPGAPVAAACGAVCLLEGGEDAGQVVAADADAGVGDGEHHVLPGGVDAQLDVAVIGELDRVGEQVVQDLAEPLLVGDE